MPMPISRAIAYSQPIAERADAQALDEALRDEHPERDEEQDEGRALGEVAADVRARHREGERHRDEEHDLPEQRRRADRLRAIPRGRRSRCGRLPCGCASLPCAVAGGEVESNGATGARQRADRRSTNRLPGVRTRGVLCGVLVTFVGGSAAATAQAPERPTGNFGGGALVAPPKNLFGPGNAVIGAARAVRAPPGDRGDGARQVRAAATSAVATKFAADGSFTAEGSATAVARAGRRSSRRPTSSRARSRASAPSRARSPRRSRLTSDRAEEQDLQDRHRSTFSARRPDGELGDRDGRPRARYFGTTAQRGTGPRRPIVLRLSGDRQADRARPVRRAGEVQRRQALDRRRGAAHEHRDRRQRAASQTTRPTRSTTARRSPTSTTASPPRSAAAARRARSRSATARSTSSAATSSSPASRGRSSGRRRRSRCRPIALARPLAAHDQPVDDPQDHAERDEDRRRGRRSRPRSGSAARSRSRRRSPGSADGTTKCSCSTASRRRTSTADVDDREDDDEQRDGRVGERLEVAGADEDRREQRS